MTDKTQPAVSVIMSVYNAEKYVGDAIESILNQSFTDFEFLLLDDGSTDNSLQIISAYKDNRIKVFSQENKGVNESRNILINKAQGQFIALLDADDMALPDRLQRQYTYMMQHPKCAVLGMSAEKFGDDTGIIQGFDAKFINRTAEDILYNHKISIVNPTSMIRASVLQQVDTPVYKSYALSEDFNLWLRMSYYGSIDNLPQMGIKYRVHNSSYSYDKQIALRQSVFFSIVAVYEHYKNHSDPLEQHIKPDALLHHIRKRYGISHPIWGVYVYYCISHNVFFNKIQVAFIKSVYKIRWFIYLKTRKA